ncbi:MAG TPA: hypothetical protein VK508_00590 [Cyclobacteriaceae bacterium]|nr:hypothetical protein [Cyclobacteriaceae bacterium]
MKTKAWVLIPLILVISCTTGDPDPAARKASFDATIETFAGTTGGHEGDGGPATAAKFGWINGLSIDAAGNMYIADGAANVIRKVNTSNVISTIAGTFLGWNVNDPLRYSGDGGPATSAHLNVPIWVVADANGNVYINDAANLVLRKVNANGVITTFAGKPELGYAGDNGPATEARFNNPTGLAVDAEGNLYVADSHNHVIRKISTTGNITTIAGIPEQAGYSGDGGPATAARLNEPSGIAIDVDGTMYITDNSAVIRKISGGTITTIAGTGNGGFSGDGGPAIEATLLFPKGIAIAKDGSIVFADNGNSRIRRISGDGIIDTIAGTGSFGYSGDGGPAIEAEIANPQGMAVDADGNIYFTEAQNSVVRVIRPTK